MAIYSFLKIFLKNPKSTGALFPSSKYLAQHMAATIHIKPQEAILELGPGTGVITNAIRNMGFRDDQLILLEKSPELVKALKAKFQNIALIEGDAQQLTTLLANYKNPISCIISGLPLRAIAKNERDCIFSEITKTLTPNGQFIQFTYDLRPQKNYYPPHFQLTKSFIIWRNLPPARVTVFRLDKECHAPVSQ